MTIMIGRNFGSVEVLERFGSDSHGRSRWLCRCTCGHEFAALAQNLTSGNTKTCGECSQSIRSGDKFGFLTVFHPLEEKRWDRPAYRCLCACGNPQERLVQAAALLNGRERSCRQCHHFTVPLAIRHIPNFGPAVETEIEKGVDMIYDESSGELLWQRWKYLPRRYRISNGDFVREVVQNVVGVAEDVATQTFSLKIIDADEVPCGGSLITTVLAERI